jgi:hypothetical protein
LVFVGSIKTKSNANNTMFFIGCFLDSWVH